VPARPSSIMLARWLLDDLAEWRKRPGREILDG
jgi:hypothetical protein